MKKITLQDITFWHSILAWFKLVTRDGRLSEFTNATMSSFLVSNESLSSPENKSKAPSSIPWLSIDI